MNGLPLRVCLLAIVSTTSALAAPLSCPDSKAVELNATAVGWKTFAIPNAYDKPVIKFQNMRVNPNNLWCQYEVGGGTVRLQIVTPCKPSVGNWEEKGIARVCFAPESSAGVAECPESKP